MSVDIFLQVVGGIGVIASIIFAGVQIRRNTIALRAAANHDISMSFVNIWLEFARNADLLELVLKSGEEFQALTRIEKARARFQFMAFMRIYEDAFLQHRLGVLTEADWESIMGDMKNVMRRPDAAVIWSLVSDRGSAAFRAFVDKTLQDIARSRQGDSPAGAKAAAKPVD